MASAADGGELSASAIGQIGQQFGQSSSPITDKHIACDLFWNAISYCRWFWHLFLYIHRFSTSANFLNKIR